MLCIVTGMKRDMVLIRKILEWVEGQTSLGPFPAPECPAYSWEAVHYHIGLCAQAGYLEATPISGAEEPHTRYELGTLTWAGHEALEELRS